MLELDPRRRATLDEILADPWVQNAYVCRQDEGEKFSHAPGHSHTLEPGGKSEAPPPTPAQGGQQQQQGQHGQQGNVGGDSAPGSVTERR